MNVPPVPQSVWWNWGVLIIAAPGLAFPDRAPWLAAVSAAILVLATAIDFARHGRQATPLSWPLTILTLMVALGWWISPARTASLPKACGVALGVAAYRATTHTATTRERAVAGVCAYLSLGVIILVPAVLATAWLNKVFLLSAIAAYFPRLVSLPGAAEGVHPNPLGATTLFFLPLALAIWPQRNGLPPLAKKGLVTAAVFMGAVLLLSQSRGAWSGMFVATALWIAIEQRRARGFAVAGLAAAAVFAFVMLTKVAAASPETVSPAGGELPLKGRMEVWGRAVEAIGEAPFTGVGLNAFRAVVHDWYPVFVFSNDMEVAHAHNIFLQTALDSGLPGLIAYLAMLIVATTMTAAALASTHIDRLLRACVLGLWLTVTAIHVFGLADAIALGAKVGLFLWIALGLLVSLHRLARAPASAVTT